MWFVDRDLLQSSSFSHFDWGLFCSGSFALAWLSSLAWRLGLLSFLQLP